MKEPDLLEEKTYLAGIEQRVCGIIGGSPSNSLVKSRVEHWLGRNEVHIRVESYNSNGTISFSDIMALRNVFDAEFNVRTEFTGGYAISEVTWEPGSTYLEFVYERPVAVPPTGEQNA